MLSVQEQEQEQEQEQTLSVAKRNMRKLIGIKNCSV